MLYDRQSRKPESRKYPNAALPFVPLISSLSVSSCGFGISRSFNSYCRWIFTRNKNNQKVEQKRREKKEKKSLDCCWSLWSSGWPCVSTSPPEARIFQLIHKRFGVGKVRHSIKAASGPKRKEMVV